MCICFFFIDETEFRNFIVWLEDQKIRHYKIEDRGNLRNIHSATEWTKSFEKYLKDVNCPFTVQERQETIDWLLGLAVRLEYGDNGRFGSLCSLFPLLACGFLSFLARSSFSDLLCSWVQMAFVSTADKYKDSTPEGAKNADNAAKNAEPLINLDVNNPDFKAGVMALANLLQIQRHDDYLVMLKAIRILVQERLSQDAVAKANQSKEHQYTVGVMNVNWSEVILKASVDESATSRSLTSIAMARFACLPRQARSWFRHRRNGELNLSPVSFSFPTFLPVVNSCPQDAVLNEAAQILRLLHIEELRELQTKINEAIVAVQAIIADPKTDHRLGKVGR
ncbi:hypothetical protein JD844_020317 [Phrynosoma platyrhinos]|uniref:RNA transcription, translation and transport factor protein n=1 Tax=Phrynosoma platyrhinos TaxID=52577 RepID=A0ABQ7SSF1_PHRPL|nr:hypothetical protein JD844_020317 [Phrynosoma platyrhinos]